MSATHISFTQRSAGQRAAAGHKTAKACKIGANARSHAGAAGDRTHHSYSAPRAPKERLAREAHLSWLVAQVKTNEGGWVGCVNQVWTHDGQSELARLLECIWNTIHMNGDEFIF